METIVDILGLAVKIDIVLTNGILIGMLVESKIEEVINEVSKTEVDKIVVSKIELLTAKELKIVEDIVSITHDTCSVAEEEGGCSSIDEVEVTSIKDTLS